MNKRRTTKHRAAYTLMELLVASTVSTLLLGGMASSIYIASQALNVDNGASAVRSDNARAIDQILRDVHHATTFTERTATAIAFTVPDRDGDGQQETLRYAWDGVTGNPLTYELNGASGNPLVAKINSVNFSYLTRTLPAPQIVPPYGVFYKEFTEAKRASDGTNLTIDTPSCAADGDLLITAVATDGDTKNTLAPPAGWNLVIIETHTNRITLGVWWKLATSSEPATHQFNWSGNQKSYGWMMRFTGHDAANPINAWDWNSGDNNSPLAKKVTTTVADTMVLRLGGFEDRKVTVDDPGMALHTAITMDMSNNGGGSASGGAAYEMHAAVGDTLDANFTLTGPEQHVTVTIAIAPEAAP